jgi:hypothetical protein
MSQKSLPGRAIVGCLAAGQPPHLLARAEVDDGAGVLVADVRADRLGDDPGAPHDHAAGDGARDEVDPLPQYGEPGSTSRSPVACQRAKSSASLVTP